MELPFGSDWLVEGDVLTVSGVRIEFHPKFNPTDIDRTIMVLSNDEPEPERNNPSFEPTDSDCG